MNLILYKQITQIPDITPIPYNIPTIARFCFISLFVLNNTASPTPAPVNSPEIKLATDITFSKYILVIITDAAQFGISPSNAETIGPIIGLFNNKCAIVSSPIKCTPVLIINVINRINRKM